MSRSLSDDDQPRSDDGRFSGKPQSDPEVHLNPEVIAHARNTAGRLLQIASAMQPGVNRVAYCFRAAGPETLYLLSHDGLTFEVSEKNGPITGRDGEQENPSRVLNSLLALFPDPATAVSAGFATTDDGVVYVVTRPIGEPEPKYRRSRS